MFSALSNVNIEKGNTLIILDEIQEALHGLTALKYFCEQAPEYHIVVAGSLLGIQLHTGTGFPVGKVDELNLYPLSFKEFLMATNNNILLDMLESNKWEEISSISSKYTELLRQYYYVGGMPEVLNDYIINQDLINVRSIQKRILSNYEKDFSKHVPGEILPKVKIVWNSIPSQLAKENKKYTYSRIKKGGRAKEFEDAIQWLLDAGLIHKVIRVSKIEKPLKFYEEYNAFKLFTLDLGLLGAMLDVTAKDVLVNDNVFVEYKGAFTEQFVLQELVEAGFNIYYYSKDNSSVEIDFIVQKEHVYPIEVKAENNLKSKSIRSVYESNNKLKPVRFSMSGYMVQDWMVNVPLFGAQEWIINAE